MKRLKSTNTRITAHIRRLEPYMPGEQPASKHVVKLNTNENPYQPSPRCARALKDFDLDRLRRYPDPVFTELRGALAALASTTPEHVFVGTGSDEILSLMARAFVEDDESIGSLDPSYSLYRTLAAIRNVKWRGSPAAAAKSGAALAKSLHPSTSLFFWTNPNAPTGEFAEPEEIAAFAKAFRGVTVVDEAYADFARGNCLALAAAPRNRSLIVMRTFSKSYSLAGLRVGWCVGPEDLIEALYKVKDSYNVDAVAQAVALAAVRDQEWMRGNVRRIVATRNRFTAALKARGWDVIPSESNFVFARPPKTQRAAKLFAALKAKDIFVRYFKGSKTGDRLRITIGTDAQMKKLTKAIDELNLR